MSVFIQDMTIKIKGLLLHLDLQFAFIYCTVLVQGNLVTSTYTSIETYLLFNFHRFWILNFGVKQRKYNYINIMNSISLKHYILQSVKYFCLNMVDLNV